MNDSNRTHIHYPTRKTEMARLQLMQMSLERGDTLKDIFRSAVAIAAEVLEVSRVGVWLLLKDGSALQCVQLFENANLQMEGTLLHLSDFPAYFEALSHRKVISAEVAQHDPLMMELLDSYLRPLQITSMMDAPIFVAGRIVGVFSCEHTGDAREWSTEERDFAASIADILALKMRASEVEHLKSILQSSEERILALQKSDILGKIACEIAHDFRNVLTSISNCANALRLDGSPADAKMQSLILESVQQGAGLLRKLAEFGKESHGKSTVIDVSSQLQAMLPLLQSTCGSDYKIDLQVESPLGKSLIDKEDFQRVLLNIVLNAKDAMPDGGTIDIRAKHRKNDGGSNLSQIVLEVRDHGIGMDEWTLHRATEPYFSTKTGGTGLGLASVVRIVTKAGGSFEIDSAPGSGTLIRILIPLIGR